MAKRIAKHLLRSPKAIADEILRRTVGAVITRVNEFTDVFADADGSTKKYLRADMTWSDRTTTRMLGPSAWLPTTSANWTHPAGTIDYWTSTAAANRMCCTLPVAAGERIVRVAMMFYRGSATNPTPRIFEAGTASTALVATPTVAWTAPIATGEWRLLEAEYDLTVEATHHYTLDFTAANTDRVRTAFVTVEPA